MLKKIKKLPPKILIVTSYKKKFFRNFIDKKRVIYQIKDPKNKRDFEYLKKFRQKKDFLISFASGFIFKKKFLSNFKKCFNFHPATPNYRGRDTHHFACYNKEKKFGGTIHLMNEKIDNGKIIKTFITNIRKKKPNHDYFRKIGINSILILFKNEFYKLVENNYEFKKQVKWGKVLYTRKLFMSHLYISKRINFSNYCHLLKSFHNKNFPSLFLIKKNKKIFLKKKSDYKKIISHF